MGLNFQLRYPEAPPQTPWSWGDPWQQAWRAGAGRGLEHESYCGPRGVHCQHMGFMPWVSSRFGRDKLLFHVSCTCQWSLLSLFVWYLSVQYVKFISLNCTACRVFGRTYDKTDMLVQHLDLQVHQYRAVGPSIKTCNLYVGFSPFWGRFFLNAKKIPPKKCKNWTPIELILSPSAL